MKKIFIALSKIAMMGLFLVAHSSANVTCRHTIGQDELPEKVKKLRRF